MLALALLAVLPAAAQAVPILEASDAEELAQTLAEATDEQGVCYGWEIDVTDEGGGSGGLEAGSSQGPGYRLNRPRCRRYAVLRGEVTYTSESSESEDSAWVTIDSNLARPPTVAQLEGLGYNADALVGDNDDQAIIDMAGVLPLLVAEAGEAAYIPFEEPTAPPPAADAPTNSPGSDWWRTWWWAPLLIVTAVGGLLYLVVTARQRSRSPADSPGPEQEQQPGDEAPQSDTPPAEGVRP